ncbi:ArsR/SmtB family transcription factor [Bartonella harrusi]|uniref:Methyltransferase domain-containing protein n=1 Tax=Bartonella harrusi TaxID=2961895 RepID=A0ABY5ETW2_9HYPH|nr:methyltransferase domain-containing protein [Bartonella harrusi]UTO27913.1 methyltransferase domain-containing protein [Bartonella harrusi]
MKKQVSLDTMIMLLKTIAETSCLRILALLCRDDLTVADFTFILGQSQSHVSQHLRLLCEVGLITFYQKGEWTYYKFCHSCFGKDIVMAALAVLSKYDVILTYDLERLLDVQKQRQAVRKQTFLQNVMQWNALRLSYFSDHRVESALLEIIGGKPFETLLGIGTDICSVLKLFSGLYTRAVEVVPENDVVHLSVGETTFDLVILYWALHFFESPELAINEIARVLRPQGRLLIVDFFCHEVDLHSFHAYKHFGFPDSQIKQWLKNVGIRSEKTVCLLPVHNENHEGLIIKLWLARDMRLLVDDLKDKKVDFA